MGRAWGFFNRLLSLKDSTLGRFATLHFQYRAKLQMPHYLRPPPGVLPEWSLTVVAQLLNQLNHLHSRTLEPATSSDTSLTALQKAEPLQSTPKQDRKSLIRPIKSLQSLQTSRWLQIGDKLKLTQAGRKISEILAQLRELP